MKKLLGIVVLGLLFISAPSKADDISDFEIEGISVGDSLLDFANEEKINSIRSEDQYKNDKFIIYNADELVENKNYDYMSATTKKNDNNYIVTSVSGIINYEELDDCLNRKNLIQNEIEKIFKYDDKDEVKYPSHRDKTGKSIIYGVQYYFKPYPSTEGIAINCFHFAPETKIQRTLKVNVSSEEYSYFLINEAK